MVRSIMHCPNCYTELVSSLKPVPGSSDYTQVWTCPNAEQHGQTVECAHGCGEQVPNPRYHYSYTPGLLGSGKWCCFPKEFFSMCPVEVEQPEPPPDPPGVTSIRLGGAVICARRMPCPIHGDPDVGA